MKRNCPDCETELEVEDYEEIRCHNCNSLWYLDIDYHFNGEDEIRVSSLYEVVK